MPQSSLPPFFPFFSVVIPTYNRLNHLGEAVRSVQNQSYSKYEIIVVDDGSVDGTREWLAKQKDITAIHQPNRGPGAARNQGIARSRGEYIAFLDSDDVWPPWTLEVFLEALETNHHPSLLSGCYKEVRDAREIFGESKSELAALSFEDYLASSHYPYSVGSGNCVVKRSALFSKDFLEDRLNGEDHDLIIRLGCEPGFVQILSPVTLGWRRHAVSETADYWRSALGAARLVRREKQGLYPGGQSRATERRRIIARHVRPTVLHCLDKSSLKQALALYGATLLWNSNLGNWKFVVVVPILLLKTLIWGFSRKG